MSASNLIRRGLLGVGGHIPGRAVHAASGAVNFVVMGQHLHEHGIRLPGHIRHREELFDLAVAYLSPARQPLYLEFGVFEGDSVRYMATKLTHPEARIVGFDSFTGLPENWLAERPAGHFDVDGQLPQISDDRVSFVAGWFDDTLATYAVPDHDRLFINVDSDLYSSAATVLTWATDYLSVGDLLYFDEFADRFNEHRAFIEYLDRSGQEYDCLGATPGLGQALFQRRL